MVVNLELCVSELSIANFFVSYCALFLSLFSNLFSKRCKWYIVGKVWKLHIFFMLTFFEFFHGLREVLNILTTVFVSFFFSFQGVVILNFRIKNCELLVYEIVNHFSWDTIFSELRPSCKWTSTFFPNELRLFFIYGLHVVTVVEHNFGSFNKWTSRCRPNFTFFLQMKFLVNHHFFF